jgi:hypothetical protein
LAQGVLPGLLVETGLGQLAARIGPGLQVVDEIGSHLSAMIDRGVASDPVEPGAKVPALKAVRQVTPDVLPDDLMHVIGVG